MRDDRDAARGIIWSSLVGLLLLVVSAVAWAAPGDPIRVCRGATEVMDGLAEGECWSNGARELIVTTVADLQASDYIMGYDALLANYVMWPPSMLVANPSYAFQPYNPSGPDYPSFAALDWQGGGGGGGHPGEGENGFHELDLAAFGESWAAAFGLVFLCWGMGKGIAVVVRQFRN